MDGRKRIHTGVSFALVREAARGRWPSILTDLGIDPNRLSGRHGPCPGCGGSDRFRFADRDGVGSFFCSGGGGQLLAGDGFDLVGHVEGCRPGEALMRVAAQLGLAQFDSGPSRQPRVANTLARAATANQRWSDKAESIWARSVPLANTPAEAYLRRRQCVLPHVDGDLRFLPPVADHRPALVARVTDASTAEPMTLHFTPLIGDGRGERKLLAGHAKAGGVIRLWPDEAVTMGLGLGEGIETALTLAHAYRPVWAAIDAGNLGRLPVLAGIEALVVAEDGDPAGRAACRGLAHRWRGARREVVVISLPDGTDLNDALRGAAA